MIHTWSGIVLCSAISAQKRKNVNPPGGVAVVASLLLCCGKSPSPLTVTKLRPSSSHKVMEQFHTWLALLSIIKGRS